MKRALFLALVLAGCHFGSDGAGVPDRDGDGLEDALDCAPDDPGAYLRQTFTPDADGDGLGAGEIESLCAGKDVPAGYARNGGDCDDTDASAFTAYTFEHRDGDGDGHTMPAGGVLCAGATRPPGYPEVGDDTDCDDTEASVWQEEALYLDTDGDGVGSGDVLAMCTAGAGRTGYAATGGDCAPDDPSAYQQLTYDFRDADGDTFTVSQPGSLCAGPSLPAGYATTASGLDCNDADPTIFVGRQLYLDTDGDGVGAGTVQTLCTGDAEPEGYVALPGDCAADDGARWQQLFYTHRDVDGDSFTVASAGSICSGASLPASYLAVAKGNDCNDANPAIFASLSVFADSDADGVGSGPQLTVCTAGTPPAGHVFTSGDCAPAQATAWRTATGFPDVDGDTFTSGSAPLCIGASLPEPYLAAANGNDCDDNDEEAYRFFVLYPDPDGDGIGAPPRVVPCIGEALPPGLAIRGDLGTDDDELDLIL